MSMGAMGLYGHAALMTGNNACTGGEFETNSCWSAKCDTIANVPLND